MLSAVPRTAERTVWPLSLSLATTHKISVDFFSSPYLDVSVRAVPHIRLFIQRMLTEYCSAGFPHSDIHGSQDICSSPWLFAAYRVLLRLLVPRHSPCALFSLTSYFVTLRSPRGRSAFGFRFKNAASKLACFLTLQPPSVAAQWLSASFQELCGISSAL